MIIARGNKKNMQFALNCKPEMKVKNYLRVLRLINEGEKILHDKCNEIYNKGSVK